MVIQFKNVRQLSSPYDDEFVWADFWVQNGKFIDPMERFWNATTEAEYKADSVVDCRGLVALPGLIDVQINGAFGIDFSSALDNQGPSIEDYAKVSHNLASFGVTSFCPTLISSLPSTYTVLKASYQRFRKWYEEQPNVTGARPVGLHLEGPFFSKRAVGAHNPDFIRNPIDGYQSISEVYGTMDDVKLVTIAPELPGSIEAINVLSKTETVVSIGHSSASVEDAAQGIEAGARMITHLFNAMETFHHRDPGIVGVLGMPTLTSKFWYGIIADGVHCHPSSISIAMHAHRNGIVLVTDAMSAMGLGVGSHQLGTMTVDVITVPGPPRSASTENILKATVSGTSTLAGSVVSLDTCVRNLRSFCGCSRGFAWAAASLHPARVLDLAKSGVGTLDCGVVADFVLVDDELNVRETYVGGQQVFAA